MSILCVQDFSAGEERLEVMSLSICATMPSHRTWQCRHRARKPFTSSLQVSAPASSYASPRVLIFKFVCFFFQSVTLATNGSATVATCRSRFASVKKAQASAPMTSSSKAMASLCAHRSTRKATHFRARLDRCTTSCCTSIRRTRGRRV